VDWIGHWGLNRDPYGECGGPYVPVPGHEEAVARLVHAIDAGHRLAVLRAPAGMGKTLVLRRALAEARDPCRRFAMTSNPLEGGHLYSRLAEKLGSRGLGAANRGTAWLALEQAVRGCALQGFQVVLAVDDCTSLIAAGAGADLRRLGQLGASAGGRVTVLLALGEECQEEDLSYQSWTLAVGLRSLSCSESETYLTAKLAAAGCREAIFSQHAVIRLHLHSQGSPSGLDRLASLCLIAGAYRRLEAISSDVVEGVLGECRQPTDRVLEPATPIRGAYD
jgi:type II secretory pathway predicted ATPase ExeA